MANVKLILGQDQLKSMLHFHDDLIAAIQQQDTSRAERAAKESFKETDIRLKLWLQFEQ